MAAQQILKKHPQFYKQIQLRLHFHTNIHITRCFFALRVQQVQTNEANERQTAPLKHQSKIAAKLYIHFVFSYKTILPVLIVTNIRNFQQATNQASLFYQ